MVEISPVENRPKSLFTALSKGPAQHPNFRALQESSGHAGTRRLMDELFQEIGAPRRFLSDFQGQGFHARVFELGCFAYLKASGLSPTYSQDSPDFMVTRDGISVAFEATTAGPSGDPLEDISIVKLRAESDADIREKVEHDFPIRLARALDKKVRKAYWNQPHCEGKPLVLAVSPFFEAGSLTYTDDAVLGYLYGFADEHRYQGKRAPSGFFRRPEARRVSAVLFTNQFSVPRFYRMGSDLIDNPELEAIREGYCLAPGPEGLSYGQYRYRVGDAGAPDEPWWQGVTVFLNPSADVPLPPDFLKASSIVGVDESGTVVRSVDGVHTLTSFMWVKPRRKAGPEGSIESWLELPELDLGEYLVTNMGFLWAPLDECLRLGVPGIPPGVENPEKGWTSLPTIAVATDDGERLCRLHVDFGPIARAILEDARHVLEDHGWRLLPWVFTLGFDERGAYMVPHGGAGRAVDLSKTPLPPPSFDCHSSP